MSRFQPRNPASTRGRVAEVYRGDRLCAKCAKTAKTQDAAK